MVMVQVRHDVRLRAAGNLPTFTVRGAEQRMLSLSQLRRVIRFQNIHHAGHFMDGVFAQLRRRAVCRLAVGFQFQPQAAFVGGDDLQSGRLADDGQIRLESAGGQRAGTGLGVFLVNQARRKQFPFPAGAILNCQFAQRGEHGGDGTLRVARAAPVQAAIFALRNKLRSVRADGVQMRREQDGLPDFVSRPQPREDIGTARQDFLKFDFQSGSCGGGRQKIRDAFFARVAVARRQESRVHAGQRDEFRQKFFRARHFNEFKV